MHWPLISSLGRVCLGRNIVFVRIFASIRPGWLSRPSAIAGLRRPIVSRLAYSPRRPSHPFRTMMSRSRDPYDRLYTAMLYFHSLLRNKWTAISAALAQPSPNIPYLASAMVDFCQNLDMHHNIEEAHIFPVLAKKLPQFKKTGEHSAEHDVMHKALGDLQGYAAYVIDDPSAWKADKAKALCTRLEKALFRHLAAEEESIKGSSLKAAGFTPAEVARIPI